MSRPEQLILEMTNDCTGGCEMCPRKYMKDPIGYMTVANWKKLVDEAMDLRVKRVLCWWRGNSLLHDDFAEMIAYAKGKFPMLGMSMASSHGIPESDIEAMQAFNYVNISIHGECPSYQIPFVGFLVSKLNPDARVRVSAVEGEPAVKVLEDIKKIRGVDEIRIYAKHSADGTLGSGPGKTLPGSCPRVNMDMAVGWDGRASRCTHVWETEDLNVVSTSIADVWEKWEHRREGTSFFPAWSDAVCDKCSQKGISTHGRTITP